ncbi:MAG: hypothetical protein J6D37_05095 [Clostridia bacterium]|nr:hypothetical protein [Clostridia bacterium]
MRKFTGSVLILLFVFLSGFFFVNDFGLIDIQKSAIVLGVGIDRAGENFTITAQLAIPQSSDQGGKTSSVEVSGTGKTVGEALTAINATTGWYPKLTFCNLIVLGESLVKDDAYAGLDYFLRDNGFSDNATLVTCTTSAKEFLSAGTPTHDISTLAIEKVLSREGMLSGVVAPVNLKEFSIGYYGSSRSGYLPLAEKLEQENGASQSDDQLQGGEEKTKFLFDATKTALFYKGKKVGTMSPEQTLTYNVLSSPIRVVAFPVEHKGISYTLGFRHAKPSLSVSMREGKLSFDVSVEVRALMLDSDASNSFENIARSSEASRAIIDSANEQFTEKIVSLIELSRESKCDLFGVADLAQKKFPKRKLGEEYLKEMLYSVKVDVKAL